MTKCTGPAVAATLQLSVMILSVALSGCGGGNGAPPTVGRVVLVEDTGIDPLVRALAGKVLATYSLRCSSNSLVPIPGLSPALDVGAPLDGGATPDGGATLDGGPPSDAGAGSDGGPPTFEEAKARALAALQMRDESCGLEPGISPKAALLPEIARYRSRWNETIRSSRYANATFTEAQLEEIEAALETGLNGTSFHGTATAGVIAYDNPGVRLVLVERPIGDIDDVRRSFACMTQESIDRTVALYSDPEVQAAYAARPRSTLAQDMDAVHTRHGVDIVNESFGPVPRAFIERLHVTANCPPVTLRAYYAMYAALSRVDAQRDTVRRALVVRAAGNTGFRIDGPEDAYECYASVGPRLAVGSISLEGNLSGFTESGRCVDAFAPGENVIAPLPGDWLMPLDGTSFAAPLVARMASLVGAVSSPDEARAAVLAKRLPTGVIPRSQFPKKAFYNPEKAVFSALSDEDAASERHSGAAAEPLVTREALEELLRPMRLVGVR